MNISAFGTHLRPDRLTPSDRERLLPPLDPLVANSRLSCFVKARHPTPT